MKTNFKIHFPKLPLNFRQIVRPKKTDIGGRSKETHNVKVTKCPVANPEFPHPAAELCPLVNDKKTAPVQEEPKLFDLEDIVIEDDLCTYVGHEDKSRKKEPKVKVETVADATSNNEPVAVQQANLDDFDKLSVSEDALDPHTCMEQHQLDEAEERKASEGATDDCNLIPRAGNNDITENSPGKQKAMSSPLKLLCVKNVGIAQPSFAPFSTRNVTIKPWRARIIRCPGAGCTEQLYSSELLHNLDNTNTHAQWLGLLDGNRYYRQNWNINSLENLSKTSVPFVLSMWSFDDNVFATVFEKVRGVWYNWIYVLGDGDTASAYEYKLWLRGATKDVKFKGTVHSIDVPKERIRNNKDCLVLQDSQIEEYMSSNGLSSLRKCQGFDYQLPIYYSISKKYFDL